MESRILVFCDPEEEYTWHLSEYLNSDKDFPWKLVSFTRREDLLEYVRKHKDVDLLLTESVLEVLEGEGVSDRIILLNESGYLSNTEYFNINKYQAANLVKKELLRLFAEREHTFFPKLQKEGQLKIIGMFTPVGRSMQTSFAICYGHNLAKKKRTLYLNFEYYCGHKELLSEEKGKDLLSLLYYMRTEREKFGIRLQSLCNSLDGLDYISPMYMGQNLVYITLEEWKELFEEIENLGIYEYLILDLSEGVQGLLEILGECDRVYTMVSADYVATQKQERFEQILKLGEYEQVLQRMMKCQVSTISHFPESMEEWSLTELFKTAKEYAVRDMEIGYYERGEGGVKGV